MHINMENIKMMNYIDKLGLGNNPGIRYTWTESRIFYMTQLIVDYKLANKL